jgi:Ras-related protein Rab-1A
VEEAQILLPSRPPQTIKVLITHLIIVTIIEKHKPKGEYVFKILLLGDSSVGKSSILSRVLDNDFTMSHISTLGVDFRPLELDVGHKHLKLLIWDTAGQERYRSITQAYYRDAHGVLLIFDITVKQTFINVSNWIQDLQKRTSNVKIVIVGNKSDLADVRMVKYDEANAYAKKMGCKYMETSAKESVNVHELFKEIGALVSEEK